MHVHGVPARGLLAVARPVATALLLAVAVVVVLRLLPAGPQDLAPAAPVAAVLDPAGLAVGSVTATLAGPRAVRLVVSLDPFRAGLARREGVTVYEPAPPWRPPRCATLAASVAAGQATARRVGTTSLGRLDVVVRGTRAATGGALAVGTACIELPPTS